MKKRTLELGDLYSAGPAMLRDFEMLEIRSVTELTKSEPTRMYRRLQQITGEAQDPCVLDGFCAAVAQARDPGLPADQMQWWYWSRKRKEEGKSLERRRTELGQGQEPRSCNLRCG